MNLTRKQLEIADLRKELTDLMIRNPQIKRYSLIHCSMQFSESTISFLHKACSLFACECQSLDFVFLSLWWFNFRFVLWIFTIQFSSLVSDLFLFILDFYRFLLIALLSLPWESERRDGSQNRERFLGFIHIQNSKFARSIRQWLLETSRFGHGSFLEQATKPRTFWLVGKGHVIFWIPWGDRPIIPFHPDFLLNKKFEILSCHDYPSPGMVKIPISLCIKHFSFAQSIFSHSFRYDELTDILSKG
jgi:hypothetical protein